MHQRIKARIGSVCLVLIAFAAVAATTVIIDGRKSPYSGLSNVSGTNIMEMAEIRTAGLTQAASQYRILNGLTKLPAGSIFKMIWPDGSAEKAEIVEPRSSAGAVPIPGTQESSPDDYYTTGDCQETSPV